jgi:hypothetical protein
MSCFRCTPGKAGAGKIISFTEDNGGRRDANQVPYNTACAPTIVDGDDFLAGEVMTVAGASYSCAFPSAFQRRACFAARNLLFAWGA